MDSRELIKKLKAVCKMVCHVMRIVDESVQNNSERSFVGGHPVIPQEHDLPTCRLCDAQLTFFFQIAFPTGHAWAEKSMAVFACTCCVNEDHYIPQMLEGQLSGAIIPHNFIRDYQNNFRIIVFPTQDGVMRTDYVPLVKYKTIQLLDTEDEDVSENKVGGNPNRLLEDESPAKLENSTPMVFIMQLLEGLTFETMPSAQPQAKLNLFGEVHYPNSDCYELFIANQVYFFGTASGESEVYILTQID
ncbi:hypothetical protein PCCS19_16040 [Paenibacillus sp. CCS19]|uniref:hypothetical protein n=1 Tax=Paenibacillus sp. CCS19 TaxID=3158387 RepID=UPI00256849D4|nr:hypothetical protein [Paenibacillus cellulosilyticus]GMK38550.1 hypothetical protein PCCS19_16040 [Paenibacillus cellulosilyticus]